MLVWYVANSYSRYCCAPLSPHPSAGGGCWQPNIDIDKVKNGSKQLSPLFHHRSTTNGNPVAFLLSLQSVTRSSLPASSTGSAWLFSQCSSQRWVISPSSARSWCSSLPINATWCRMPASLAHWQILIRILTIPTMPRASTWIDSVNPCAFPLTARLMDAASLLWWKRNWDNNRRRFWRALSPLSYSIDL